MAQNSWLTVPAKDKLIFEVPAEKRWETALETLGIHSWDISPDIGHA
jgi:putative transcriptional regulator